MNSSERKPLVGKRIGIFGKGGSGKSTFTVVLAKALRDQGYSVCVLDADSTNVGLHQALGIISPPKPLLEYYGGMVFSGGLVTCPVDDPTPLHDAEVSLDALSSQYYAISADGIFLLVAGKIGDLGPGAGCDGPVAKIARDIIIHENNQDPITLIDFKAGFEDSARGAITKLDFAIVVVDPTTASIEIAANMRQMVNRIKASVLPATAHLESPELVALANQIFTQAKIKDIFFVLNKIPNYEIESYLREKLSKRDIEPIGIVYEDLSISFAWLKGEKIQTELSLAEVDSIVNLLEEVTNGSM
jgi:CO dehydrogenase maturation factor